MPMLLTFCNRIRHAVLPHLQLLLLLVLYELCQASVLRQRRRLHRHQQRAAAACLRPLERLVIGWRVCTAQQRA